MKLTAKGQAYGALLILIVLLCLAGALEPVVTDKIDSVSCVLAADGTDSTDPACPAY